MVKRTSTSCNGPAARRTIRYGSDFSGLGTTGIALNKLVKRVPGLFARHTFSCDNNRTCKKIIMHHDEPDVFYDDIMTRDNMSTPRCDVYSFTSPCQSFSTAGKGKGMSDPRGAVMLKALEYIEKRKPTAVLAENVAALTTRHRNVIQYMEKFLTEKGYKVFWRILSTADYGIPQVRKRWYMMAVSSTHFRSRAGGVGLWPAPLARNIPLSRLITPVPPHEWRALPVREPARTQVEAVYFKVAEKGINPFTTPVVIDIGATEAWQTMQINKSPTITRGRASQFGYWVSTKGARMALSEMAMLQGFAPHELDWEGAQASKSAYAACLGNAQSLNVVMAVLPHLLYFAKLATKAEFEAMVS